MIDRLNDIHIRQFNSRTLAYIGKTKAHHPTHSRAWALNTEEKWKTQRMVAQTKSMQLYVYKERYHMRPSVITTNEEKGKRLKERIIIIRPSNSDIFTSHGLGYVALAASGRRFRIMCGTCNFDGLGLQLFWY